MKWWLLAIPHYVVLAIIGAAWVGGAGGRLELGPGPPARLLVLVAAIMLLFVGRYPRGLFDLVMGLNRWVYRVIPYAALMTDATRRSVSTRGPGSLRLLRA